MQEKIQKASSIEATEKQIDQLLSSTQYNFLNTPTQKKIIDDLPAQEALEYIQKMLEKRLRATFEINSSNESGFLSNVNPVALHRHLHDIFENSTSIGEGGDANVVTKSVPAFLGNSVGEEICYKFLKNQKIGKGRNDIRTELEMQEKCYYILKKYPELRIKAPVPYFATSIGNYDVLGMERLKAKTLGEIKRGLGVIPDWLDIDQLKINLRKTIDVLHSNGFYHRDLHENNVMIPQSATPSDTLGYIIDFGLSTETRDGFDPYSKTEAGNNLTYKDDYAILIWMSDLSKR